MATLTSARVHIRNQLPDGFLDCQARELHGLLDGPTLFELPGKREPPLFVSILLHGNEDTGLAAVQRVLRGCAKRPLPRSLMLLVGNIEAAHHGLRRLDDQPDYNRIWPGATDHGETAEARIMAEVHARVVDRRAVAAVDLHNNSGRNPHYAVVCNLRPPTLALAALFAPRVVLFRGIPGTQTASFEGLIPAMTAECGLAGDPANADAAARFLDAALHLVERSDQASGGEPLELYHTLGVVRVRPDVRIGFGSEDAQLRLDPRLDELNFRELQPGALLGETDHVMPLQMIDEAGCDVADDYFAVSGGSLLLSKQAVPAMLTADPRIVRQDCLCYLMQRIRSGVHDASGGSR